MDYDSDSEADEVYQRCLSYLLTHAPVGPDDTVVDIGAGTGIIALELAPKCDQVVGRDIYDEWLQYAREKAARRGIENVSFGHGSFRDPTSTNRSMSSLRATPSTWPTTREVRTNYTPPSTVSRR